MQNHILLALLLDPFLTFDEVAKEFGALTVAARRPNPDPLKLTTPSSRTAACRRPARTTRGVPVLHHPPVDAG